MCSTNLGREISLKNKKLHVGSMQVIAELIFKLLLALNLEIQASRVKRVDKLSSGTLNMNIL
jgi:hypothetical protein